MSSVVMKGMDRDQLQPENVGSQKDLLCKCKGQRLNSKRIMT